jgi:hypothetical protein
MAIHSAVGLDAGNDLLLSQIRSETASPFSEAVRCVGPVCLRTQAACDLANLLDVDRAVQSWCCLPLVLVHNGVEHVPDFLVTREDGVVLMDASVPKVQRPFHWFCEAAGHLGLHYERHEFSPSLRWRLENARELLVYASHPIPLPERLLLLACLDEYQSLPFSACMHVIRASPNPVGVIAAMALRRFVEIDLDQGRIGPETRVSRFHG